MNVSATSLVGPMTRRVSSRYVPAAEMVAEIILEVLKSLRGTDPSLIERWVLTETDEGEALLFAVVNDLRVQSYQPWVTALHALSTSLQGRDVFISNTTGFRYAVLLSDRPALPIVIPFPGVRAGIAQIGVRSNGRHFAAPWLTLGHVLVAGQTQYGKSNFLRVLALQARADGFKFLLADVDGRTFSMMKNDLSLALPIARTKEGFTQIIEAALAEMHRRVDLFDHASWNPDNLGEYNAQADEKLEPMFVMLDEYSSMVSGMGGPRGAFAGKVNELVWRGLKFGIQVTLSGQDFSKEIVGAAREQMRTRLCFRVATPDISEIVIGRRGAENIRHEGRAMMESGVLQTYFVDKELFGAPAEGPRVSEAEKVRIMQLIDRFDGRADLEGIQEVCGMNERAARRIRDDWGRRGLIEKRASANNAWFFVQTPWASKPVQTASERPDGVQTALTPVPFPAREGESGNEANNGK